MSVSRRNKSIYASHAASNLYFDKLLIIRLFYEYSIFGKQTVKQLSAKYKISVRTVHCRLSSVGSTRVKDVVVLMDTIYWGRNFDVVVMKDSRIEPLPTIAKVVH